MNDLNNYVLFLAKRPYGAEGFASGSFYRSHHTRRQ